MVLKGHTSFLSLEYDGEALSHRSRRVARIMDCEIQNSGACGHRAITVVRDGRHHEYASLCMYVSSRSVSFFLKRR